MREEGKIMTGTELSFNKLKKISRFFIGSDISSFCTLSAC
jgi:hypothetical protein